MNNTNYKIHNKCKDYPKFMYVDTEKDDIKIGIKNLYKCKIPGFTVGKEYFLETAIFVDELFVKQLILNIEIAMSDRIIKTCEMWVNNPEIYGYAQEYDIAMCKKEDKKINFTLYRNRGIKYKNCHWHDITLDINEIRILYKELVNIIKK